MYLRMHWNILSGTGYLKVSYSLTFMYTLKINQLNHVIAFGKVYIHVNLIQQRFIKSIRNDKNKI